MGLWVYRFMEVIKFIDLKGFNAFPILNTFEELLTHTF